MTSTGSLALVLTAHVPYVRTAGRNLEGEDALHRTIAYALVPTVNALYDLYEQNMRPRIALAWSPVLLEQLADPVVQKHFVFWMQAWLGRADDALARSEQQGNLHAAYVARFFIDWGRGILESFERRYERNLVTALRHLCDHDVIEPLATAATHAYLPLLERTESVRAQLDVGALTITQRMGHRPRGVWLPECGYHPRLNQHILAIEMHYLIVDPVSVEAPADVAQLRPRWAIPRRLSALFRHVPLNQQVWSIQGGYPGDPLYLGPLHQRSGDAVAIDTYDPYDAFQRAHEHAVHFHGSLLAELAAFRRRHDRPGVAVVPIDAELFSMVWFEGPTWLRALLEQIAEHPHIELTTPGRYLRTARPRQGVTLREGSWAANGDHSDWMLPAANRLWQAIHKAETHLAQTLQSVGQASATQERILNQAIRELLLAQSSDWPLLLGRQPVPEALSRPLQHVQRCNTLCQMALKTTFTEADADTLDVLEELDNAFPNLNYRVFSLRR